MDIGKLVNTDESRITSILAYQLNTIPPIDLWYDISSYTNELKAHIAKYAVGKNSVSNQSKK